MKTVLVAGATGYLGSYIVKELKQQGFYVKAVARSPAKLSSLSELFDDALFCELNSAESLGDACENVDFVISAISEPLRVTDDPWLTADYLGNINLLNNAIKHKVKKFITVSLYNIDSIKHAKILSSKIGFPEVLAQSTINSTIVNSTALFPSIEVVFKQAQRGRAYILGKGDNEFNPIHGADLAKVCVNAIFDDRSVINVGGPMVVTQRTLTELAFEAVNKKPVIYHIPNWYNNIILSILKKFFSDQKAAEFEFYLFASRTDFVAPAYGKHSINEFFAELAQTGTQED